VSPVFHVATLIHALALQEEAETGDHLWAPPFGGYVGKGMSFPGSLPPDDGGGTRECPLEGKLWNGD